MTDRAAIALAEIAALRAGLARLEAMITGQDGQGDAGADGLTDARARLRARCMAIGLKVPVDGILTEQQVADLLDKHVNTIRAWRTEANRGVDLKPHTRLGRILYHFDDVARAFAAQEL